MEAASVQPVLFVLVVKLGIMASFASLLLMSRTFRLLLTDPIKDAEGKFVFALPIGVLLFIGVVARVVLAYDAGDLALESAFALGLIEGTGSGVGLGIVLGLAGLLGGEYLALPLAALYGAAGGLLGRKRPAGVDSFDFSYFPPATLFRALTEKVRHGKLYWPVVPLGVILGLEVVRMVLARTTGLVFAITSHGLFLDLLVVFVDAACVGIPLRVWHEERVEKKLEELAEQSARARLEGLQNQIQPHFLFNTLSTISTLVRTDPELGRALILKLAGLLRRMLYQREEMVPLAQELDFVDDYLAIELARFGERLAIEKRIDPAVLSVRVPPMILQPIVENAVRHGVAPRIEGGTIRIECRSRGSWVEITVRDAGAAGGERGDHPPAAEGTGVGVRNVEERLKAVYGDRFRFRLDHRGGRGAEVVLTLPAEAIR